MSDCNKHKLIGGKGSLSDKLYSGKCKHSISRYEYEQLQQEHEKLKKMVDWLAEQYIRKTYTCVNFEYEPFKLNKLEIEIIKQAEESVSKTAQNETQNF